MPVSIGHGTAQCAERGITMAETTKAKYDGPTGIVAQRSLYGYSSSRTADTEAKTVEVIHISRCKDGEDVYMTNVIDFSTTDMSDILEVAAGAILIAARPSEFRTMNSDAATKTLEGSTFIAKDYIKRERKSKSYEDKVADLVAQGIPRESAEMILKDPVAFYKSMQAASKS